MIDTKSATRERKDAREGSTKETKGFVNHGVSLDTEYYRRSTALIHASSVEIDMKTWREEGTRKDGRCYACEKEKISSQVTDEAGSDHSIISCAELQHRVEMAVIKENIV